MRTLQDFRSRYPMTFEDRMDSIRYQEKLVSKLFTAYLNEHNRYHASRDKLKADFQRVRYAREAYRLENDVGLSLFDA